MENTIKNMLVDVDGVLVDVKKQIVDSYMQAMSEVLRLDSEQINRFVLEDVVWGRPWTTETMLRMLGAVVGTGGLYLRKSVPIGTAEKLQELADNIHGTKNEILMAMPSPELNPAMDVLLDMFPGRLVIYTGGSPAATTWKLHNAGTKIHVSERFYGVDKTAQSYLHLTSQMSECSIEKTVPHETLVIDDDRAALEEAARAGFKTAHITYRGI